MCLAGAPFGLFIFDLRHIETFAVFCHNSSEEGNRIVQLSHQGYKSLIIQTKSGKMLDHFYIGHIPDQLIIYGTQEIDKSVFSAGTLDTADNLVALFPFSYKYRNHIHRILKIAAHNNGTIS